MQLFYLLALTFAIPIDFTKKLAMQQEDTLEKQLLLTHVALNRELQKSRDEYKQSRTSVQKNLDGLKKFIFSDLTW